jgi:V8-like Glu-specific endopeptidase
MQKLVKAFLLTSALSTAVWAMPALSADISAGKEIAAPEASRSMGDVAGPKAKSGPRTAARSEGTSRAPGLDEAASIKNFTIVTRSKNGTETRTEPTGDVLRALKGEKKAEADTAAPKGAADPILAEEGARAVIGQDNRLPVSNSLKYPYVAVGFLDVGHEASQTFWGCSATVIGPSTIITAASCIYNHELEGGWLEMANFWPAINGEEFIPFEPVDWVNMSVFEAFITGYDGTYDSIWPYDVAIIELAQPIGDTTTGWLGFDHYSDLGDFEANLVAYNDDTQPAWGQSRSVCQVTVENSSEYDFLHDCDSDNNWSFGAPLYYYDQGDKTRRVLALNMGGGDMNWALRLYGPILEWMYTVVK